MPSDLPNLRDVGGLPAEGGATVAAGRVLRSALPFDDDLVDGVAWPPTVVLDLRSAPELEAFPTMSGPRVVHLPLLSLLAPDAHLDETLAALYLALLDSAGGLLVDVVREVADADGPVLVHCAAGKDRTGIAVALLLRLVGVEREHVMADYLLTDDAIDAIDARLRAISPTGERRDLPREYFHVVPDALGAVLDRWDAHPDGTAGWLVEAGGDADLIDRLRARLLASD